MVEIPAFAEARTSTSPWRQRGQCALYVLPLLVLVIVAVAHRWMVDDGFINLRVVRQIEAGNGPVFNAGQRVESYTSPLWLAVLLVADAVAPFRLEYLAVGLGIIGTTAGFATALAGSTRLARANGNSGVLLPFGILIPLAVAPTWYFASSGLENGLVFAWEGACLLILATWASKGKKLSLAAAFVVGLGTLIRPELALMSIVLLAAVLAEQWRNDTARGRVKILAVAVALPFAYELFRMGYFGNVVANTAIAKEAASARWNTGWRYFSDFASRYALWFPAAAVVAFGYIPLVRSRVIRRSTFVFIAFAISAVVDAMYVVRVGGDWMPGRLLLPALLALVAPVMVIPARRFLVPAGVVLIWALVCGLALRPAPHYVFLHNTVTLQEYGWSAKRIEEVRAHLGTEYGWHRVASPASARPTLAIGAVGATGYALGPKVDVLDLFGLADSLDAHFALGVRRNPPGSEKPMPRVWALAILTAPGTDLAPEPLAGLSYYPPLIPPTQGRLFTRQVEAARAVLKCGDVRRLIESYSAPLTFGRVVDNFFGSFHEYTLRIPPDPITARQRFCG